MPPEDKPDFTAIAASFLRSPAIAATGLRDVALAADGTVTAVLPLKPEHERGEGTRQFHGGPIAAFIDTVGDIAVAAAVGGGVPTINIRIDYLKPAVGGHLAAAARVRRLGRTVAVADVDVTDEKGSLVAVGRGTYGSQPG
jgi:uncharacterized protein (TIGR00369 family)